MAASKLVLAVLFMSLICSFSFANDKGQHEACIKGAHEGHSICKGFCKEMKDQDEDDTVMRDCINDCNFFLIEGIKKCVKYVRQ